MTQSIGESDPGTALFPEYATLYDLIAAEVQDLSDAALDFESDRWSWSEWSIRRQLSHMASLVYRWLLLRWGGTLFPDGNHGIEDVEGLAQSSYDRRLDEDKYWTLPAILDKLEAAIDLSRMVLRDRDVGFLRGRTFIMDFNPHWDLMIEAHPGGITRLPDEPKANITLEATMRHMYFEEITHLYNIQRLKRAQGLPAVSELPKVGYWVLDGWDTSEP